MKYDIMFDVSGLFEVEVEADSIEEACEEAGKVLSEADFCELEEDVLAEICDCDKTEGNNEYTIVILVDGCYTVENIEADSLKEALRKAEAVCDDADFGELTYCRTKACLFRTEKDEDYESIEKSNEKEIDDVL